MKTKEELNALKEEYETLNKKLAELTGEELAQVTGGMAVSFASPTQEGGDPNSESFDISRGPQQYEFHFYKIP